uniref:Cysteine/serine-rich nuclear protein N-terminal domain-containing protein n=1 Tax=Denticeps clupeoides TaxID=299321 RepID=A0AAY4B7M2_9TELE
MHCPYGAGAVNSETTRSFPLPAAASILKREKRMRTRRVHFENVTVYYFSRRQGFTSVPSQGGSTLGMSNRHSCIRQYTLGEFAMEQERLHRDMLRDHLKEEKLNSIKLRLTKNGAVESEEASALTVDDISDDDLDLDNTEVDEYFFLQPLTTKKRRALLRASGVKKIDVEEKHELRAIRVSREDCGCDCRVFCDPETCACSVAGIKCQVDRMSFPCGCTKEGCSNAAGRIEFNPIRVRTHFLHTIMKLELEKSREQQQQQPQAAAGNGYHGEGPMVAAQHELEYPISGPVQQTAVIHLRAADEIGETLEEEDDDDEEEEEDDEDDDENVDEDDEEVDEESSSLCSGLSDSSTQSLAASDSEEEEDEEEEEDDEDEEDEDKMEDFEDRLSSPVTVSSTPTTHAETLPAPTLMRYPPDNQTNGNTYFLSSSSSSSSEYYQMDNASTPPGSAGHEPFADPSTFQDRASNRNRVTGPGPFSTAPEQYTVCCAPDQDKGALHGQMEYDNYLNNNSHDGHAASQEVPHSLPEVPVLPDATKAPPLLDSLQEVSPV